MYYCVDLYHYYLLFDGHTCNVREVSSDKDIWAFAYKEDERATNLMCKPVKGRIKDEYFYEYKVNGKDLKKNGVTLYARYFADTYEEAVKGFNALVNQRIESLRREINKLENMVISLDGEV